MCGIEKGFSTAGAGGIVLQKSGAHHDFNISGTIFIIHLLNSWLLNDTTRVVRMISDLAFIPQLGYLV